MDVDARLNQALDRGGQALQPDVPAALRDVRDRARRRTTAHRFALVGAAALAAALALAVVQLVVGLGDQRSVGPVGPAEDTAAPSQAVSLTVVSERSAPSLGLEKLLGVAVSPDGRIYVTDASQQVAELDQDLDVVRTWGGPGTRPGRFRLVTGSLAVGPDGRVYVSDTGNFRLQVFSPDGQFERALGDFGTGPGQFTWPFDLVVDDRGQIYVADDKQLTLTKLSPTGRELWRRGAAGETDERFLGHHHLAMLDPEGRLLSVNDDNGLVMLVNTDGTVAEVLDGVDAGPGDVCGASLDQAGRYYLTPCTGGGIRVFDEDGSEIGGSSADIAEPLRWAADGRAYAITTAGSLVEVEVVTD